MRECETRGIELWDLTDEDLAGLSAHLTPDVRTVLSVARLAGLAQRQGRHRPGAGA